MQVLIIKSKKRTIILVLVLIPNNRFREKNILSAGQFRDKLVSLPIKKFTVFVESVRDCSRIEKNIDRNKWGWSFQKVKTTFFSGAAGPLHAAESRRLEAAVSACISTDGWNCRRSRRRRRRRRTRESTSGCELLKPTSCQGKLVQEECELLWIYCILSDRRKGGCLQQWRR